MRLESELKATGYAGDPDTFQDAIRDVYSATNRNCSVDNFFCRPWDHRDFCGIVRMRLGLDETADDLILRTLLNMRKRGEFQFTEPTERVHLSTEMASLGLDIDPEEFREAIADVFLDVYKAFSVDQLLMRWRDSLHFCALIRGEFGVASCVAVNELVLRTLLNSRRKGSLSIRDRVAV